MRTYIFKTQFLHAKKIVREIEVLETANLYQLAEAIVSAYGFDLGNSHFRGMIAPVYAE